MIDNPKVLIVQNKDGEMWTNSTDVDFDSGNVVKHSRARLYARTEKDEQYKVFSVGCLLDFRLVDAFSPAELAEELARRITLQIKEKWPDGDK